MYLPFVISRYTATFFPLPSWAEPSAKITGDWTVVSAGLHPVRTSEEPKMIKPMADSLRNFIRYPPKIERIDL